MIKGYFADKEKWNEVRGSNLILHDNEISNSAYLLGLIYGFQGVFHQKEETFEPIPLTPEWLERAGFEKVADRQWQMKHELPTKKVMIIEDKWISGTNGNLGFNYSNENQHGYVSLFCVHQFQNLIHALTGEELEFNLDNLK